MPPDALCRDCLTAFDGAGRCPGCGSPRVLAHPELRSLAIAHVDCDAFYASVEKRDDPSLRDRPLIVGGGRRGVVTTACYIARIRGVKSAMPMFKALALCPEAVVVPPRMARYVEVSREIRARMDALTPLVEPLSLDEAFLDLTGTERLHGAPPATLLARMQAGIEADLGLTVSVGLSHNKFLAKIASELDKPRGFRLIGREETARFLAGRPIGVIWGVGPATLEALEADGLRTIADLRARGRKPLAARFGAMAVSPDRPPKSVSNETTFETDLSALDDLGPILWRLAESVSARLKARGLAGRTVTLKLRRPDFRIVTRRATLESPTAMADTLYRAALPMLQREISGRPYRLIGIGASELVESTSGFDIGDLFDPQQTRRLAAEEAADRIRKRFGADSIALGRGLR
jgi:DNA polymerase-4